MLTGFNTNVPYKGDTYHIQTEDNGEPSTTVVTLLYFKGTILSRKMFEYRDLTDQDDWKEKVTAMMKKQHISLIKELLSGMHNPGGADDAGQDA